MTSKYGIVTLFIVAILWSIVPPAQAGTVRFEFANEIDHDNDPPNGTPPWMIATFEDAGQGHVILTINNLLQSSTEFARRMVFNLDPTLNADNLNIQQLQGPMSSKILAEQDGFKNNDAENFDILLRWKNNRNAFLTGDTVQFDITGIQALQASSFNFENNDPRENSRRYFAGAQIGNVGQNNEDEWLSPTGVPLPSSFILALLGLATIPVMVIRTKH